MTLEQSNLQEKKKQERKEDEEKDCLHVVPDCSPENAPAASDDCGHTDPVVRAWSQSKERNLADPVTPAEPKVVAICDDDEEKMEEVDDEEAPAS